MIKRLLSLVTAFVAFCCIANAQALEKNESVLGLTYKNVIKSAPQTRASGEGLYFTYAVGTSVSPIGARASHYDCAIFVPKDFAGNKIDAIAFYLLDHTVVGNVKCWIAKNLPTDISTGCDFIKDVTPKSSIVSNGMPEEVIVDNYTIPAEGCYVGYSFDVTNLYAQYGQYPIATDGGTDNENGAYVNFGNGWDSLYGQGFGNLMTVVEMSGNNFLSNAAAFSVENFNKATALINGSGKVFAAVQNKGVNPITSIAYKVKDVATGQVSDEKVANSEEFAFYQQGQFGFELAAGSESGIFNKEVTITKVNGQANEYAENTTATGSLLVVSREVPRKVVVEEFTSTSCTYCPRGYAGMSAMKDKYPDTFIGIAVHAPMSYDDPMTINDYSSILSSVPGYPYAYMNRTLALDPYFGTSSSKMLGVLDDYESLLGASEAEVTVSPVWNEAQTVINVNTDVKFLYNSNEAPYALAYVLLADGLQGSDYTWWQLNEYYGATGAEDEPYIYEWTKKGELVDDMFVDQNNKPVSVYMVKDMVYDHVAVKAQDIKAGSANSIAAPIVMEQSQIHTTTFDVSNGIKSNNGAELLQDKSKLKVVAMLINTETGEIVNADEKEVAPYGSAGIESLPQAGNEVKEVARYTIDGVQLSAPAKGINIVKMSDGTTRKVVVKQ